MKPVVFLNSHPIQYFVPLYQKITRETNLDLKVLYYSSENIDGILDREFGLRVQWDIPMLEGYSNKFLKNYSFKPSIYGGFWGLVNFGVLRFLYKQKKSIVIIHGWNYATSVFSIIGAKLLGHVVCLRAETPLNQELLINSGRRFFKKICLKSLFRFVDEFLFVGEQNKLFYQYLGISKKKLLFVPYCVDNDRFSAFYIASSKLELRIKLGLPSEKKIILFSGKLINKKRPMDLLIAFKNLRFVGAHLVFVGDGELKTQIADFIKNENLDDHVTLSGFINQSEIPNYYSCADIFVMCSGIGETWGLSINEAMNFALPIIVSGTCGSADDLVVEGVNGFTYKEADIEQLEEKLIKLLEMDADKLSEMGLQSRKLLTKYSFDTIIDNLKTIV